MTSDADALAAFCEREHPRLVGALSLYCGDAAVAQELAQEALLVACRRWSQVRQMASPGAWVHRVGMNLANSYYRRRRAERRAYERRGERDASGQPRDLAARVAVRQAVAALPERQRAALVLRFYLDHSIAETAELLGVSTGAVKQLTHRALKALREQFPAEPLLMEAPDAP